VVKQVILKDNNSVLLPTINLNKNVRKARVTSSWNNPHKVAQSQKIENQNGFVCVCVGG
jgi:hypothetical protein